MIQLRPCELYHSAGPSDGLGAPACMHPEACLNLVEKNLTDPSILSDNERMLYEEMKKCASGLRNQLIEVLARSRGWDKEENNEFHLPPDRGRIVRGPEEELMPDDH